jgi:hypothetical protein
LVSNKKSLSAVSGERLFFNPFLKVLSMRQKLVSRSLVAIVALSAAPVVSQAQEVAPASESQQRLALTLGPGVVAVRPTEDYYLPNDGAKLGLEAGLQYTAFFKTSSAPQVGLRASLLSTYRAGRFRFQGQEVRRQESFVTVPLEVVLRRNWREHTNWQSSLSVGGYFSELAQRFTYTLDPTTGKTLRDESNWTYGIGGLTASYGIGIQGPSYFHELGLRASTDLGGFTRSAAAGALPNLRCSTYTLYYTVGLALAKKSHI